MTLRSLIGRTAGTLLMLSLAACGGGGGGGSSTPTTFTIGGTVTGLAAGTQVVLNDNGADALTVTANGSFTFATNVDTNGSYAVTLGTPLPTGQTCTVSNGAGTGVTANVTTVNVTCSTNNYVIGGTVTGLTAGQQVTLVNGTDVAGAATVTADGAYTFATPVAFNSGYAVTVGTQPTGLTCTVANGTGAGVTADVTNANVTCSVDTFTIGGTVSGLAAGQQVTLNNNSSDPLTVTADGSFTFATPVTFNGVYAVTVGTQPTGQTCTATNGSGAGVVAAISNVTVTCSTNTFTIGGTVSGLAAGQQVTLNNNSSDSLTVTADGSFTFATPVTFNGVYTVTVGTQPTGQTCTATNGSGAGVVAAISNVTVTCSTNTFTIGGTVSGLAAGQQVTLNNNSSDPLTVSANGNFIFATPVAFGGTYAVTVGTNPTGQTCTVVSNGSASGVAANVANVAVSCSTNTFVIGGTIAGLEATQQVTLKNNNGDPLIVGGNGPFTFATPVAYDTPYAVTVGTQPTGQTCRIGSGSGSHVTAIVNTVSITCRLALAYVVNATDHTVSQYTIGLNGALTSLGAAIDTQGTNPNVVTVDPTGRFAYVANHGSGDVTEFSINATTGALSFLGTVSSGGPTPYSVAVDPTGQYVYVTNQDDPSGANSSVAQFTIGADGRLTPIGSGLVTLLNGGATSVVAYQITVDPTGHHVYVANRSTNSGTGTISQFDINATTGALTWSGPDVSTGTGSGSIGIAINAIPSVGTFAYVSDFDVNKVSQFNVDASTGRLTLTASPSNPLGTEVHPYPIAVSADGQFAYWANKASNSISQCKVNPDGSLPSGTNTTGGGNHPQYVAIDPFSRHVYVVSYSDASFTDGQGNMVSQYDIVPSDGTLTPITGAPTVSTGLGAFSITTTR